VLTNPRASETDRNATNSLIEPNAPETPASSNNSNGSTAGPSVTPGAAPATNNSAFINSLTSD
jgi:hypothetical protein